MVLILVVLVCFYEPLTKNSLKNFATSLNPCCAGLLLWTTKTKTGPGFGGSLNPCCAGLLLWTAKTETETHKELKVLILVVLVCFYELSNLCLLTLTQSCLNPCCAGLLLWTLEKRILKIENDLVLILVVLVCFYELCKSKRISWR